MTPILAIPSAVTCLREGGVVAYPTEAVWGLGCDPTNERAVMRLLALKQRDVGKGLILVAGALAHFDAWVDWPALPADRLRTVHSSWPGPHTWIVPASAAVPRWITGDHDGVAVRVSAHPVVAALCGAFGGALVSTSANPAAAPAPATLALLDATLRASLDGIVGGETSGAERPTTIRDARTGVSVRV